jgi:hypothetical protein
MLHPSAEVRRRLQSLDTFLRDGIDEFRLADHVDHWLACGSLGYPLLAVSLEALPVTWPAVRAFLDLPASDSGLPTVARRSDWCRLPRRPRDRLQRMYGSLTERLAAMPAVQMIL